MPTQRNSSKPASNTDLTLEEALRETARTRWEGRRCYATNMSQATRAVHDLARACGGQPSHFVASKIPADLIQKATAGWYAYGLSPATINKRLNCLSAMGVNVEGCRAREPKVLKWWLKPEDEEKVVTYLRTDRRDDIGGQRMAALVSWTTRTGLRIEESLRLTWGDVSTVEKWVTVPGLKTAAAQATLPLSVDAVDILNDLNNTHLAAWDTVFRLEYDEARHLWELCRQHFGWQDNPTATLKALRRSAARHLHVTKGMPLDMVRQYLRHEDLETTLGYLRLTGGYGTEEMRRWL